MTTLTNDLVNAVGNAFNNNDINAVMEFFAEDAIFDHASGSEVHGKRFEGRAAIKAVFSGLFDSVENVNWETLDCCISDTKAYCEYRRVAKLKTGEQQDFLSVDILTFKDGLIVHKDTYYKHRTT